MNQKGSALLGTMVGAAVLALAAMGYATMNQNHKKALKGASFQLEVDKIHDVLTEILKDSTNCTASVKGSFSSPPNLAAATEINAVVLSKLSGGTWSFKDFYQKGPEYAGAVKIASLKIRPFNPQTDPTPGHKFVVTYERVGNGLGASTVARTMDFRFDTVAIPAFSGYNFSCTSVPGDQLSADFESSPMTLIGCGSGVAQVPINCAPGKQVMNCGVRDNQSTDNEDSVTCYLDIPNNRCMFSHEISGNCDTIYGYCYCM